MYKCTLTPYQRLSLDLELAEELGLLLLCLPLGVAGAGSSRDELELDLLEVSPGDVGPAGLEEGDNTLPGTGDGTLDHDAVATDVGVVRPATDGVDGLLGEVELGGARVLLGGIGDAVDLVVDGGTAVVTVLTGTSNREHDLGRVPCSDTSDLTETTVGLTGKLGDTPTGDDTSVTLTLGHTDNVDALVLLKDLLDGKGLLKVSLGKLDLLGDGATVDLDLGKVSLLLGKTGLAELGVGEDTDDSAVLLDALKLTGNGSTRVLRVLLGVAGEGLLLGTVPVLVEATLDLVGKVLGPDGGKGTETTGSLDVTDDTDDDHRWGVDNGDGLDNLTLVHLGSWAVEVTDNVAHTSLVTKVGGEVDRLLGVILGEGLDVTTVLGSTLAGKEGKRTRTRLLVLKVSKMLINGVLASPRSLLLLLPLASAAALLCPPPLVASTRINATPSSSLPSCSFDVCPDVFQHSQHASDSSKQHAAP